MHIAIYTDTKPITLPCLLAHAGKKNLLLYSYSHRQDLIVTHINVLLLVVDFYDDNNQLFC